MSLLPPKICEGFSIVDSTGNKSYYRCDGYMRLKIVTIPKHFDDPREQIAHDIINEIVGPPSFKWYWCNRNEAEFVCGSGVCGCCVPVARVKRSGKLVEWPLEHIQEHIQSSKNRNGRQFWSGDKPTQKDIASRSITRMVLSRLFARKD